MQREEKPGVAFLDGKAHQNIHSTLYSYRKNLSPI
jgi:hypothetical protein